MRTQDPFVAIDAGTDIRAHARALRDMWEAERGGCRVKGRPRGVIAQSWSRLALAGLDPEHLRPRSALDPDGLGDARAASPLSKIMPVLRRCLGALMQDAGHVMVITDGEGRILWLEGDPRVKDEAAERITFAEGMLWTEDSAGTNAIGTALAIDHSVQVFSAEHFLAEQHGWWCSAAPLHDPLTGSVLGVVDLSGPMRTAHPHSLGLVSAAAAMAEESLRLQRAEEENRLRQTYVERVARLGRHRSAIVGDDGRVLVAEPAGWIGPAVALPPEGGSITLPDGHHALVEPLEEGGHLVWGATARDTSAPGRTTLRLELLGRHNLSARVGAGRPLRLGVRQAEILALLALHPSGMTCDQLTLELYGEEGNPISTRAQMSRLRRLLGAIVAARPYRLLADVTADFLEVESALASGDTETALRIHRAPLLSESEAPGLVQARNELEGAVRRAAMARGPDALWSWLESESGRDDIWALEHYIRASSADDPRRALAASRLRALQVRWQAARS
jgi:hypothetical protein